MNSVPFDFADRVVNGLPENFFYSRDHEVSSLSTPWRQAYDAVYEFELVFRQSGFSIGIHPLRPNTLPLTRLCPFAVASYDRWCRRTEELDFGTWNTRNCAITSIIFNVAEICYQEVFELTDAIKEQLGRMIRLNKRLITVRTQLDGFEQPPTENIETFMNEIRGFDELIIQNVPNPWPLFSASLERPIFWLRCAVISAELVAKTAAAIRENSLRGLSLIECNRWVKIDRNRYIELAEAILEIHAKKRTKSLDLKLFQKHFRVKNAKKLFIPEKRSHGQLSNAFLHFRAN